MNLKKIKNWIGSNKNFEITFNDITYEYLLRLYFFERKNKIYFSLRSIFSSIFSFCLFFFFYFYDIQILSNNLILLIKYYLLFLLLLFILNLFLNLYNFLILYRKDDSDYLKFLLKVLLKVLCAFLSFFHLLLNFFFLNYFFNFAVFDLYIQYNCFYFIMSILTFFFSVLFSKKKYIYNNYNLNLKNEINFIQLPFFYIIFMIILSWFFFFEVGTFINKFSYNLLSRYMYILKK